MSDDDGRIDLRSLDPASEQGAWERRIAETVAEARQALAQGTMRGIAPLAPWALAAAVLLGVAAALSGRSAPGRGGMETVLVRASDDPRLELSRVARSIGAGP